MTEISGTLDGIGLVALLNFLAGLKAGGRLAVVDRDLSGSLSLADGRVVGATFGSDTGQVALDAIALVLGAGRFNFTDDSTERPANLSLDPAELRPHLEQLAAERQRMMAGIPSLDGVPVAAAEGPDEQPIMLDRGTLRLLLRADGRSTVLDLAHEGGLLATLKRLAHLVELGLIRVEERQPPPRSGADKTMDATTPRQSAAPGSHPPGPADRAPTEAAGSTSQPRRAWWQGHGP